MGSKGEAPLVGVQRVKPFERLVLKDKDKQTVQIQSVQKSEAIFGRLILKDKNKQTAQTKPVPKSEAFLDAPF